MWVGLCASCASFCHDQSECQSAPLACVYESGVLTARRWSLLTASVKLAMPECHCTADCSCAGCLLASSYGRVCNDFQDCNLAVPSRVYTISPIIIRLLIKPAACCARLNRAPVP
jgi:hypothetical protein